MNALHREREKKAEWKALLNKGGWGWPCQKSEGSWQSGECLWPGLLSFALQLRLRSVLSHNTICILDYFVCASWPGIPSQELLLLLRSCSRWATLILLQGDPELGGFASLSARIEFQPITQKYANKIKNTRTSMIFAISLGLLYIFSPFSLRGVEVFNWISFGERWCSVLRSFL